MTATVTYLTASGITSNTSDALWFARIAATLLLLGLIAYKELFRAMGGSRSTKWANTLNIAIVPLLLSFAFFIVVRLLELLS